MDALEPPEQSAARRVGGWRPDRSFDPTGHRDTSMTDTVPIIRIERLSKSFGSHRVLNDVSLNIESGEKICIIGPSGSGKSTLLRCINRLEEPTGGEIWLEGKSVGH